jgi:hypothetical protein
MPGGGFMRISVIGLATCLLLSAAWAQQDKGKATPESSKTASSDKAAPAAVETKTYKGTLVDASCSGNVTQTSATAKNTADRAVAGSAASKSGATDDNKACGLSTGTKEFALRTTDGRVIRFDTVGNERAADAIKNRKKWSDAVSSGKAISAKVSGTMDGDTLTVVSI